MNSEGVDSEHQSVGFAGIRRPVIFTLGLGALLLGLIVGILLQQRSLSPEQYVELRYYPLNQLKKIEVDSLMTHRGTSFLTGDLEGHWSLLFFGYSYCPDVCPTTLGVLNNVARELSGADAPGKLQVVMVTVDPDRDTAAKLAGYVPYFNSDFVGVTGEVDAILALTAQLNIGFEKVIAAGDGETAATDNDTYEVAHSTQIVVVNPNGYYTGMLTAPHQPERIVKVLTSLMRE